MASIMYAWEFGAALGHIGTFLPVARALRDRGHTVHWVVTHPHQAARLLPQAGFDWLAAPLMQEQKHDGPPVSYADILLRFGYANSDDLLGITVAWRELYRLTKTALVIADHAPTAILAGRTTGIPVMLFGGGFFTPPPVSPTPNMRHWNPVSVEVLQAIDRAALITMNAVLERFAKAPLAHVAELFQVDETALLTFPELDHYDARGPAKYWGMLPAAVAHPPQWPIGPTPESPRLFAYMRSECAHFEVALQALATASAAVLIYVPGVTDAIRQRYASPYLHFAEHPVDLTTAAHEASAAVTYASAAATVAFLFAGKPVLMLPGHLEQFLFATRVEQMGSGILIRPEMVPVDLPGRLRALLGQSSYRENAQAFAAKYAAFDQSKVVENLVNRIEELVSPLPNMLPGPHQEQRKQQEPQESKP